MSVAAAVEKLEACWRARSEAERINFDPEASANLPRVFVSKKCTNISGRV